VFKGANLTAQIIVYPGTVDINAVGATVRYSSNLEVVRLSRTGSFCTLYPEEYVKSKKRLVRIGCGAPSPGLTKSMGIVGTIVFRAKESGYAKITLDLKSSSVHANDGKGTDVLASVEGAAVAIVKPVEELNKATPAPDIKLVIRSPTHPDRDLWYPENDVILRWQKVPGAEGYAILLDNEPKSVPSPLILQKANTKEYNDLADGVWYFHLRAKKDGNWSHTSHFPVKIDTTPPELSITTAKTVIEEEDTFEITFAGPDAQKFLFKLDNESFALAESPLTLSALSRGRHFIVVKAVDRAGNTAEKTVTVYVESKSWWGKIVDRLARMLLGR